MTLRNPAFVVAGASLLVAVVMLGNRPRKTVQPPKSPPPDYEKNMERRFVTPNELEWPTDARMRLSLRDPQPRTEDDDIFDAWVRDPRSGAPALTDEDLNPEAGKRRISAVERWLLAPYFPVSEDLDDRWIVNGYEPPPLGGTIPVNLYAWAEPAEDGGAKDGYVVFPNETRNLINRWWISCLAHELWHLAQARIGLTPAQTVAAFRRWGYVDSPIEVQARWQQKRVFDGVTAAAREFFDLA